MESTAIEQSGQLWSVDLKWLEQNNRSFSALARDCLCPACSRRLEKGREQIGDAELLTLIRDCCAKAPGFITGELPILEATFRIFLGNGNEPLDLERLSQQLKERRGGDSYRTAPQVLSRLLKSDRYYGLRPAETKPATKRAKPKRRDQTSTSP